MTYADASQSTLYTEEYSQDFADSFDGIAGWEARSAAEGDHLTSLLRRYGARRVLDAACGTGFHLALLADRGFELSGSDGAPAMIEKARVNLAARNLQMPLEVCDWRTLSQKMDSGFDAVLCLGDSFAHLLSSDMQLTVLRQFAAVLKPGGIVVIDHRNYDRVVEAGTYIERPSGYCCCGDAPPRTLTIDEEGLVNCHYKSSDGKEFSFRTFPVRRNELTANLRQAGFTEIETLVEDRESASATTIDDSDFLIEVAVKGQPAPETMA